MQREIQRGAGLGSLVSGGPPCETGEYWIQAEGNRKRGLGRSERGKGWGS